MPELPEVETMRRGIADTVGCCIKDVQRPRCALKAIAIEPALARFRKRVVGREIAQIERIGKRVIVRLDSDDGIVFEPRMTGLVLLADPPNREHLRLRLTLASGQNTNEKASVNGGLETAPREIMYWDRRGLGSVRLMMPDDLSALEARLGPDALVMTVDFFEERLCDSRREIKVALLDQHAVSGIGNLYASEILHAARIHPETRCERMRRDDWDRIHRATRKILKAAIRYEGSTLADGTYRNALNQTGSYQNQHRVYAREGQRCTTCGRSTIRRIVQAQRATFFCPRCQRRRRG